MNELSNNSKTVTVIAKHYLLPNKESEFRNWSKGIGKACSQFAGYLGTEVIQPTASEQNEYVVIFRFDNYKNLKEWMDSDKRKVWLTKSKTFVSQETDISEYEGLGFWFRNPKNKRHPSVIKMSIITYVGLLPLVLTVPALMFNYIELPSLMLNSIATAIIVLLMSYIVMPFLTKVCSKWLY